MNQIKCDPHGVKMAENLRTFASLIESGEITSIAVCMTYEPGSESAVGSSFWTDDETGSLFSLVGAVRVLDARIVQAFGVDW